MKIQREWRTQKKMDSRELRTSTVYYIDDEYIDGFSAEKGRMLAEVWNTAVPVGKGIALLPVYGPLGHSFYDGATSYSQLSSNLAQLSEDSSIHTILMLINSPGGDAAGLVSLCNDIKEACGKKRVVSLISNIGCSAAYAIAVSASECYIEPDAITGSCGAYAKCIEASEEYMKKQGILSRIFRSSNAPKKAQSPVTNEDLAKSMQERIDTLGSAYMDLVSECRGKDKKVCEESFGQGASVDAQYALEAGMVDGITTYKDLISSLDAEETESADESEGADMDIEKMSAEERQELFNALCSANPELLASVEENASKAERERVVQMSALYNGDEEHDAIVKSAIEGKKDMNALKCELFDFMQSQPEKKAEETKNEGIVNAKALEFLAEADQAVNTVAMDASEEMFQKVMNQVKEARK